MSYVVFLAPVKVPAVGQGGLTPGAIVGKDHAVSYTGVVGDEEQLRIWQSEGKVGFQAPVPRGIRVAARAATTAQIAWTVDESCTSMTVAYGTTSSFGSSQAATPAAGVGDVVANLTGLTTATLYYYRVQVNNAAGNANTHSPTYTFTTL